MSRPASTAEIMNALVRYLDRIDELVSQLAEISGDEPSTDRTVQTDLLMIAAWMREHPEIDAQIHSLLELATE